MVKEVCIFFFFPSCGASDRGRLRRSFGRHSMRWAVLNPVHCNRTRGGRSRSPAFLQNAVCLHDCHCAGGGGRWQLRITAPSDNTYCLHFLFNIYQEDKKPTFIVLRVEDVKTLKPNWVKKMAEPNT